MIIRSTFGVYLAASGDKMACGLSLQLFTKGASGKDSVKKDSSAGWFSPFFMAPYRENDRARPSEIRGRER